MTPSREQDEDDDRDDPREEDLDQSDAEEEGDSDFPGEEWQPRRGALFHVTVWVLLILFALGILSMIATVLRRMA